MLFKNKKNNCSNSGFETLKDFLNYLQEHNQKYKVILDSAGNWCASVGNYSLKKILKEQEDNNENDNTNNNWYYFISNYLFNYCFLFGGAYL